MFSLISLLLPIILFIAPTNAPAISTNIDLLNARSSVGTRFAEVYCEAITEGLDSGFASEYALNNTYLKFVAFPDDEEYLDDLWQFTNTIIAKKCGNFVERKEIKDLEIFFKEEALIASNRELYLPTFENN